MTAEYPMTDANYPMGFPAYTGGEPYVFVSYAHADRDKVGQYLRAMRGEGYRIWYDEGIPAGLDWREEVAAHIKNAARFVLFLSPTAITRPNVINEICYAETCAHRRGESAFILCVETEATELTPGMEMTLRRKQGISAFKLAEEVTYRKLFAALPGETREDDSQEYEPLKVGDVITFGHMPFAEWTKPMALQWQVLEVKGQSALLMAKTCVANAAIETTPGIIGQRWENTTLHRWLNGEFYAAAFSEEEKTAIRYEGISRINLLALEEMKRYLRTKQERKALFLGCLSSWWLRQTNPFFPPQAVSIDGDAYSEEFFGSIKEHGIRPILSLDLTKYQEWNA